MATFVGFGGRDAEDDVFPMRGDAVVTDKKGARRWHDRYRRPVPPPLQADPLLVDHLEGNRKWRDRYREAVRQAMDGSSPAPNLRPFPTEPIVYVQWLDSSMRHEQVDGDRLPTPSVLHTVGWLAAESDEFVTVAREQNPDPDSYRWRGSVSIPLLAILDLQIVGAVDV